MLAKCAAIERSLRDLEAVDALLVHNEVASYLGEQRLSVQELQRQHPVVLDGMTRAALDQRISRLRRRLAAGGKASPPTRDRSSSLCTIMAEIESEGVKS
jgi:hypothetical protein